MKILKKKFINFFILFSCLLNLFNKLHSNDLEQTQNLITTGNNICFHQNSFSKTYSKFLKFDNNHKKYYENNNFNNIYIWEQEKTTTQFSELILSWNAIRPKESGFFEFWISVKNSTWSNFYKIAEWGKDFQQTFFNINNNNVQIRYSRVVIPKKNGSGFKIKIIAKDGADIYDLNALFVNVSNLSNIPKFKNKFNAKTTIIKNIPQQSQMVVNHPRACDLCSPTSLSIVLAHFANKKYTQKKIPILDNFVPKFAQKVHDDSNLNIYGNWPLNVAEGHNFSNGDLFLRAERLNGFDGLYYYISKNLPISISIRGYPKGSRKPYTNGHFIVITGWNNEKQSFICIDPAFSPSDQTLREYKAKELMKAWRASSYLSYVGIPKKLLKMSVYIK